MSKTALVTGASEGIGRAFAVALAKSGYQLTLVARNESRLNALCAELGAGHRALVADLSVAADVDRVVADLAAHPYDLLVNNAGVGVYGAFQDADLEKVRSMVRLNVDSVLALTQAFLKTSKSGDALINVASTLAFGSFAYSAVYAATKAFVLSFSESLWYEQSPRGVYVQALCPGVTETKFHQAAGGKESNKPPQAISQTPEEVVAESLAQLAARARPTVICGPKNKAMIFMTTRVMSRKRAATMMGGFAPK